MKPTFPILLLGLLASCGTTPEDPAPVPVDPGPEPIQPEEPLEPLAPLEPEPLAVTPAEVPDPEPELDPRFDKRFRKGHTRGGRFTVAWRPLGDGVPKNEHFEVEVYLWRNLAGGEVERLPGARLGVSGWMPDHGHGMIRKPRATDAGDGRYVVRGMLLQMGGYWQVFFDVLVDNQSERAQFDLVL